MASQRCLDLEYVVCPSCEAAPVREWLAVGETGERYVRCVSCGNVFASPRSCRDHRLSRVRETYTALEAHKHMARSRERAMRLAARAICRRLPGGRLLDVGCSTGTFFRFFRAPAWECYGVELSPEAAEYAARQHSCRVHCGQLQEARFESGVFDIVTLLDTFYTLDDPLEVLREVGRIVRKGGLIAVEVPGQDYMLRRNYGVLPGGVARKVYRAEPSAGYLYWYSVRGLHRLLARSGFRVMESIVLPGPRRDSGFLNALSIAHFVATKQLSNWCELGLRFAPRYLCLAMRR